MKVIFAGTPEFAATALAAIHAAGHEIVLVLTQPDRPAGRGMQLHASAVKQFALAHQIPVLQPTSLRLDGKYPEQAKQAHDVLMATQHDVMVVAAYGLILPESVLTIPPRGCLNIHASLLPRWRGAAPIHRAIEAGDKVTGITIMQMDQGLDTGAMLLMQSIPIAVNDNTASLHDKLAKLGGEMIVDVLKQIPLGKLAAQPQPLQGISYASKISKEESFLDFNQSAELLQRKIRALNPAPGAHGLVDGVTFKLWNAELAERPVDAETGQFYVKNNDLLIACGVGALQLLELQKPGGRRLLTSEFLKGFAIQSTVGKLHQ
jgi:methionyl-tRNA formyltransferase